ncbi:MAG: CDP-diacylglycerol--serine O-phosphatidyltransferase, partial [Verrucomicrobiota bacterium]
KPAPPENGERVKIYLLPNLFTAGNLACGFFALTWIFKYVEFKKPESIDSAIYLILAAFAFDLFDGRVARMMKKESPFGREFDSLADIVSFGVAPAFLVYSIILGDFPRTGWIVAAVYLVCGGIRLARFNVLSTLGSNTTKHEFIGLPIPSAAALVVSVTMLVRQLGENNVIIPQGTPEHPLGPWRYALPLLMLLVAGVMVSNVRYPTFKQVEWTARKSVAAFAGIVVAGLLTFYYPQVTFAFLFVVYLIYGLVRPWVRKSWRREIEEDESDDADVA